MGNRGPVPKRSEDRIRRNSVEKPSVTVEVEPVSVVVPVPDENWHPIARRLWDSLALSGQSKFYEPSDWALAYSLMDDLTYYKFATKRSGQMLASIYAQMSSLLISEGDRRRAGIELARKSSEELESAGVMEMNKWREALSS